MNQLKIHFVLLFVLFVCSLAWGGGRQGPDQVFGDRGQQGVGLARGHQGDQRNRGAHRNNGGNAKGFGEPQGRYGAQSDGPQGDRSYRSNLYSDDDVYGYDATYPNGEASYINYKSKDARARRGPEFARTSRAYSRQGGDYSNFGRINEYRRGSDGES